MAKDSTLHIRLENDLKKELEKYGEEYDLKLSNVIRIALEEFAEKDHARSTNAVGSINLNAL